MTTSSSVIFHSGARIEGKWNRRKYTIQHLLGEGSNGQVYLVRQGKLLYALKVGYQAHSLQSEVNAFEALSRQNLAHRPVLYDVDDVHVHGRDIPYYVMPYIQGSYIQQYVDKHGTDWLYLIGTNLLRQLKELHQCGWIFGDLKIENVLVSDYGKVALIDYGGATQKGKAVKQFTEIYDRGYWNCGSRVADHAYDLFSTAILMLMLCDPKRRLASAVPLLPQHREAEYLISLIEDCPALLPVQEPMRKMVLQEYSSTEEAYVDWRQCLTKVHKVSLLPPLPTRWISGVFIASMMVLAIVMLYVM